MINTITSNQQISFTGKTYSKKAMRECEEFCEDFCKNIKKGKKKFKKPSSANYRAYTTGIVNTNNLERCPFGYKARRHAHFAQGRSIVKCHIFSPSPLQCVQKL